MQADQRMWVRVVLRGCPQPPDLGKAWQRVTPLEGLWALRVSADTRRSLAVKQAPGCRPTGLPDGFGALPARAVALVGLHHRQSATMAGRPDDHPSRVHLCHVPVSAKLPMSFSHVTAGTARDSAAMLLSPSRRQRRWCHAKRAKPPTVSPRRSAACDRPAPGPLLLTAAGNRRDVEVPGVVPSAPGYSWRLHAVAGPWCAWAVGRPAGPAARPQPAGAPPAARRAAGAPLRK